MMAPINYHFQTSSSGNSVSAARNRTKQILDQLFVIPSREVDKGGGIPTTDIIMAAKPIYGLVNLRFDYNRDLLMRFYEELMMPNFSMFQDELESIDSMEINLKRNGDDSKYKLHIILAMEGSVILGGICCEFFPKSQCGLFTYLVTSPQARGKGISRVLIDEGLRVMNLEAEGGRCKAVFLETNNEADSSDVMDIKVRQEIFRKLGFEFLDFAYVQPALEKTKKSVKCLILGVHTSSSELIDEGKLASPVVLDWLAEQGETLQGPSYMDHEDFLKQCDELMSSPYVQFREK